MVAMYDKDNSGTIDFNGTLKYFKIIKINKIILTYLELFLIFIIEFSQLYQFVTSWINAFKSADTDEDLQIDQYELNRLLNNLGDLLFKIV